jgi:DNA invertase Pin-like site-specific DNA recombinase
MPHAVSQSVVDGAGLMEEARSEGWALHFADLDIDTSTPVGEMAANIIISGSQYERRLISQRTRDALAAKRARGERLGRLRQGRYWPQARCSPASASSTPGWPAPGTRSTP